MAVRPVTSGIVDFRVGQGVYGVDGSGIVPAFGIAVAFGVAEAGLPNDSVVTMRSNRKGVDSTGCDAVAFGVADEGMLVFLGALGVAEEGVLAFCRAEVESSVAGEECVDVEL